MSTSAGQSTGQDAEGAPTAQVMKLTLTAKQIIQKMSEVTSIEITNMVKTTTEVTVTSIDITIFSIFEYQGFDPEAILRKLYVLQVHYGLSDEDMKLQIMYMIAANIYMGNLSGKALGRRSQDGRDMIDGLCSRYEIRAGTTNTGLPSDVLTFPRIAGSFPVLSCKMAMVLPTKDHVGRPFTSVKVPRFMRMNAFASLCHKQLAIGSRLFLLKAVAAYSCDQGIVYEEGRRKKMKMTGDELKIDPTVIAAEQWTFIWNASESNVPEVAVKKSAMLGFNVIAAYNDLKPIVENYNKIMSDPTPCPSESTFSSEITAFVSSSDP